MTTSDTPATTDETQNPITKALEAVHAHVQNYLTDYEIIGESETGFECCHTPTEFEAAILEDATAGLLADDDLLDKIVRYRTLFIAKYGDKSKPPLDSCDMSHMWRIDDLIAELQQTRDRFGNTCVYIRRGGMGWGAVALNRRDDDRRHGVFDLQAQHDRDMQQRAEQIERLIAQRERDVATFQKRAVDLRTALEQAQACILGETPEDMPHEEARQNTLATIKKALNGQ